MPEEKLESPARQDPSNLDEQTLPPEVETEKRPFVGKIIDKIKLHQKKIFIGLALFLGVFAIAGVANRAYWLSRWLIRPAPSSPPTPIETPTPTPDPTADWGTYTNLGYGYLIKYSPDWFLEKGELLDTFYSYEPPEVQAKDSDFWRDKLKIEIGRMVRTKRDDQPLNEWYEQYEKQLEGNELSVKISQEFTQLAGEDTIKVIRRFNENEKMVVNYYIAKDERIYFISASGDFNSENRAIFDLMLSTFKFLTPEEKQISFRIDEEGDITKVILINIGGEEKVLREYRWPDTGRARELFPSPNNKYLAISSGTALLGSLEIVNLENEQTVAPLSEYGQVMWLDDHRLVLNAPEEVEPERPYEGGEGVSLAAFDAASNQYRVLKKADEKTDYPLLRIENEEVFFEKRVVKEKGDWTQPTITQWKINFEGTVEMEVK